MQQLKTQIDKSREHLNVLIQETVTKARDVAHGTTTRRRCAARRISRPSWCRRERKSKRPTRTPSSTTTFASRSRRSGSSSTNLLKQQAQTEMTSRLRGEHVVERPHRRSRSSRLDSRQAVLQEEHRPGPLRGRRLGVGLALFLSYMDRSLRSVEDVGAAPAASRARRHPGAPRASRRGRTGTARSARPRPESEGEREPAVIELLPHSQPRSRVAEAYRAFRAALLLSRAGGVKSIVITSCLPEGRQELDRGQPRRRARAARQAGPAGGRGSSQAAAARDLPASPTGSASSRSSRRVWSPRA